MPTLSTLMQDQGVPNIAVAVVMSNNVPNTVVAPNIIPSVEPVSFLMLQLMSSPKLQLMSSLKLQLMLSLKLQLMSSPKLPLTCIRLRGLLRLMLYLFQGQHEYCWPTSHPSCALSFKMLWKIFRCFFYLIMHFQMQSPYHQSLEMLWLQ